MRTTRLLATLLTLVGLPALAARAQQPPEYPLRADSAWARPAAEGAMAVVYAVLINDSARDRIVTGVSCQGAAMSHLHRTTMEQGMAHMAPVERLDVPAHGRVELQPGGLHIMLMGLQRDLAAGDAFRCELMMDDGVVVPFQARVRAQ